MMAEQLKMWDIGRSWSNIDDALQLKDGDINRVLSIVKVGETVTFVEECDAQFSVTMSKEDAIIALQEAIAWIAS